MRRQAESKLVQEFEQVFVLGFRRRRVHPIQRRDLAFIEKFRGLDIGRDHAFLDQLVRVVARLGAELDDIAGGPEPEFDFAAVEIDRAALLPRFGQHFV